MPVGSVGSRVLVRVLEEANVTASGLVLPGAAKEKPRRGEDSPVLVAHDLLAVVRDAAVPVPAG